MGKGYNSVTPWNMWGSFSPAGDRECKLKALTQGLPTPLVKQKSGITRSVGHGWDSMEEGRDWCTPVLAWKKSQPLGRAFGEILPHLVTSVGGSRLGGDFALGWVGGIWLCLETFLVAFHCGHRMLLAFSEQWPRMRLHLQDVGSPLRTEPQGPQVNGALAEKP